jgi:Putative DNA-binding domain
MASRAFSAKLWRMAVDLFSADYSRLTDSDLYAAIEEFTRQTLPQSDRTQEGYTVDFKEKWGDNALRVVAAFANTFGGAILIGVSEDGGRAKDLVGEESKGEIKTRLASSIATNISPTPSFEIAECTLPTQPDRRLAVIRVRSTNRIHFLTAKNAPAPVYIRNEDEAVPARAPELRNLIERERNADNSSVQYIDTARLLNLLPITKAQQSWGSKDQSEPSQRIAAPSVLSLWVIPDQIWRVPLDYDTELTFRNIVFRTFPKDSFLGDSRWDSSEEMIRDRNFARIDYAHLQRDLQSKWVFTNMGEFGYATILAEDYPPGGPLWSLSDLTIELIAAVTTAHSLLTQVGYLGDASVHFFANPGQGRLHQEAGKLPFIRHTSENRQPPAIQSREVVPKSPNSLVQRDVSCFSPSNFQTRTERLDTLIADLLNQLLRGLGYGAVLTKLREYVASIAR